MSVKRILTGMRPTGALHLGHYVGALKQWALLQEEFECFFLIADVQAMTTHSSEVIEGAVREVILDWISIGLDPTRPNVHFVLQSGVPELTELTIYLSMLVSFAEIERNPTIKAERAQLSSSPSTGFMIYPVSQVADILLFNPSPPKEGDELLVPVGDDQIPHLELSNRVAHRFNQRYGRRVFLGCTARVGDVGRLPGTDGKMKMGKSLGNAIYLADDPNTLKKKIAGMFTDTTKLRRGDPGNPNSCPVFLYHSAFGDKLTLCDRKNGCTSGRLGCVRCKNDLTEVLNNFLTPIRTRRKEAEMMPLGNYLRAGTKKAREVGGVTINAVRQAMRLDYPNVGVFNK